MENYIVISLLGIIALLTFIRILAETPKYNHIEPVHYLDSSIIVVDAYTAHRLKFKLGEYNKHIEFTYNKEDENYILTINHFSENHKREILKEANLC